MSKPDRLPRGFAPRWAFEKSYAAIDNLQHYRRRSFKPWTWQHHLAAAYRYQAELRYVMDQYPQMRQYLVIEKEVLTDAELNDLLALDLLEYAPDDVPPAAT